MRRWLILLAFPALAGLAPPPERFEARGSEPTWRLRIALDRLQFDHVRGGKRKRDLGRVERIDRSPGRALVSALITEYEFHPLGIKTRNGRPISNVETREVPFSIEVIEAACTEAGGRRFPTQVTITDRGEAQFRGCGGSLTALDAEPLSEK